MKKIFLMFVGLLFISGSLFSAAKNPSADRIMKIIDGYFNHMRSDYYAQHKIIRQDPKTGKSVLDVEMFRKDRNKKFLIFFLGPKTEFGKGYLSINDTLWFYNPATREFIRKTKKESFGGSDARSRDFERSSLSEVWKARLVGASRVGRIPCYLIQLTAKIADVAYPIVKIWVRRDNYLPVKREEYTYSKRLAQVLYYISYIRDGRKYHAKKLLIINKLEPGKRTLMILQKYSNRPISNYFFTKTYLEKRGR